MRLDTSAFAQAGGDSGKPILGATLETNELLARVSSSDRTYRMPKNAAPLSPAEIKNIRQWVSEGTPWSDITPMAYQGPAQPFYHDWILWLGQLTERYESEFNHAKPYLYAFLAVQIALLVLARAKAAYHSGRRWTTGKAAGFCRFAGGMKTRELLLVWLLSVTAAVLGILRGHELRLASDLAAAQLQVARYSSSWSKSIYGSPPVPFRPDHPKQIAGTYYRGNCERNPELFNNGNYLTAIFRVNLCDSEHAPLELNNPVPSGGLYVRVEIERAPGTTDLLFSKQLMDSVFFSEEFVESTTTKLEKEPTRLESLEEGKRWVADVPIGPADSAGKLSGLIYLYTGRFGKDMVRGEPHYGVKYDLIVVDGKLVDGSDLWMNSFGNPVVAPPTPRGKIPYNEWFDFRPIPAIEGENSKDPKLLGVEEYERKGLIKPQPPPNQPPTPGEAHKEE